MDWLELLCSSENLYWAWDKVQRYYRGIDGWHDELEVAQTELRLETELREIANQFRHQRYRMRPMRPLPQPKRRDRNNLPQTRQMFSPGVRDQIAWIAYLNIIGPLIDPLIPAWSYGNRLHRSVWFEESSSRSRLRIGPYRNTSGQIYRPFRQSWPVYRRHIHLTIRKMAGAKRIEMADLDPAESRVFESETKDLSDDLRLAYLRDDYWNSGPIKSPYWAGFDLEKFYPNVNLGVIKDVLRTELPEQGQLLGTLLDDLLTFPLDLTEFSADELRQVGPNLERGTDVFSHLPTGLMAAGFLANVALLRVDQQVGQLAPKRQIAHFRYVDDHVVLATSFESLVSWIAEYRSILDAVKVGASFNVDKFEPESLGVFLRAGADATSAVTTKAGDECQLDPRFPSPLMTQTLAKISDVNRSNFELLDDQEQEAVLNDLEHLLLAEFPNTELRPDTRVTFAAARIARIASKRRRSVYEIVQVRREIVQIQSELERLKSSPKVGTNKAQAPLMSRLGADIQLARRRQAHLMKDYLTQENRDRRRTLQLLLKSLREFPEKIRLWQHVLNFCLWTGQLDLSGVLDEVRTLRGTNGLATAFIGASLLQILSKQVTTCARTLISSNASYQDKKNAWRFLRGALAPDLLTELAGDHYYQKAAMEVLKSAAGLAVARLKAAEADRIVPKNWVSSISRSVRRVSEWDWDRSVRAVARASGRPEVATWIWWAESISQGRLSDEPGMIWLRHAPMLSASDADAWAVWRLYPGHLPRRAKSALPGARIGRTEKRLIEVEATINMEGSKERPVTLVNWVDWTRRLNSTNPFDPRVGEWTSIAIAIKSANLASAKDLNPALVHPYNYRIPLSWSEERFFTWEQWRDCVRCDGLKLAGRGRIHDRRFDKGNDASERAFDQVAAVATILLGLLRRSFRWPALWNPVEDRRARSGLIRGLIRQSPCSSWTTAVIEGALLPRNRETTLLRLLQGSGLSNDDTTHDPPMFATLPELVVGLKRAQAILEAYQISVQNHQPRQMVPISLTQIAQSEWNAEEAEDED